MKNGNGNARMIGAALGTLILVAAGGGIWLAVPPAQSGTKADSGTEQVNRRQVVEMIGAYSPYIEDRAAIRQCLEGHSETIKKLTGELHQLTLVQYDVAGQVDLLVKTLVPDRRKP